MHIYTHSPEEVKKSGNYIVLSQISVIATATSKCGNMLINIRKKKIEIIWEVEWGAEQKCYIGKNYDIPKHIIIYIKKI